jgi:O-antigen/teichoic acid export membrane protein
MNKLKKFLTKKANLDDQTLEVLEKAFSSVIVKVIGMATSLFVSVFLAKNLGAKGLGVINISSTIINVILVITMFGFKDVIVKNIAIANDNGDKKKIRDTLRTATVFNGSISTILTLIILLLVPFLSLKVFEEPELEIPLYIAVAMVVPQTFSRVYAAALNGFKKIWQSSLVDEVLSVIIVGIGLQVLLVLNIEINLVNVAILYGIGRIIVTSSIVIYFKSIFKDKENRELVLKPMLKMGFPLLLAAGSYTIISSADKLMLGWIADARQVGLYSVAMRLVFLPKFFLLASNMAISPNIASLFSENRLKELQALIKKVSLALFLVASFFLLLYGFLGGQILGIWGEEFKEVYAVLLVLFFGQFINISTGCVGQSLVMCGYEKIYGYISLVAMVLNVVLNFILITYCGIMGAAIATTIVIVIESITRLWVLNKKILNP